jgi:hypothetical protein
VVVDDGSTERLELPPWIVEALSVTLLRIESAGAAEARNSGARQCGTEVLVFIDDDVVPEPGAVMALADGALRGGAIAVGRLSDRFDGTSMYADCVANEVDSSEDGDCASPMELSYGYCLSGFLALRAAWFWDLGGFQDPTGDWPSWDDIYLGYRAQKAGIPVLLVHGATAVHWDRSLATCLTAAERWFAASRSAAKLIAEHPDIRAVLPMFDDKWPIALGTDSFATMVRKLLRAAAASKPAAAALQLLIRLAEEARSPCILRRPLYRWYCGGAMYRGLRAGLVKKRT